MARIRCRGIASSLGQSNWAVHLFMARIRNNRLKLANRPRCAPEPILRVRPQADGDGLWIGAMYGIDLFDHLPRCVAASFTDKPWCEPLKPRPHPTAGIGRVNTDCDQAAKIADSP